MTAAPLDQWPRALDAAITSCPGNVFTRARVFDSVESTQDVASRMHAASGDVIVAWRQTGGRGRLGRRWIDTGTDGIAATFVVPHSRAERLSIAAAVAVATVMETILPGRIGIKWPNDILCDERKLAGVLVEQSPERALIGIGINISQTTWPADLALRATSVALAGGRVDRLAVLTRLVHELAHALIASDDALAEAFTRKDVLTGSIAVLQTAGQTVTGEVIRVDPLRGLEIRTSSGVEYLPAAITTVLEFQPATPAG